MLKLSLLILITCFSVLSVKGWLKFQFHAQFFEFLHIFSTDIKSFIYTHLYLHISPQILLLPLLLHKYLCVPDLNRTEHVDLQARAQEDVCADPKIFWGRGGRVPSDDYVFGDGGGGKDQTTILVLHVALVPMKFRFYRGSPDSLATSSDSPCFAHRAKQLLHLQRQILHLRPPFVLRNLYKHKLKVITFPTCRFLARHLTLNVVTIFTKYA